MPQATPVRLLGIALVAIGLTFMVGLWPLMVLWPSGWSWHGGGRSEYAEMIVVVYATLGVFLLRAARDPLAHRSLIEFTIWSSVAHGGLMAVQALAAAHHHGHLAGDVPALFAVAATLAVLLRRAGRSAGA